MKLNADFDYVWTAPRLVWRGAEGIRVERDEAPSASTVPAAVGRHEFIPELPPQMRSPRNKPFRWSRRRCEYLVDSIVSSLPRFRRLKARKARGR